MNCESQKLLKEISILDFAVVEIVLFLDTHPGPLNSHSALP